MLPTESRHEYATRLHRVVEYIDRHLDERLELAPLAEVAHFSAFHFHRLFAAWMGETLGDYVRRRRLEVAATRLLAQPRVPVLDVALSVGFGSTEAFAHAFRARFGISATAWRRANRKHDQVDRNHDQAPQPASDHDDVSSTFPESDMQVQLANREPMRILYLRYTGPYGKPLGDFWKRRVMPWIASRGLERRPMVGISHDDPEVTAPEKCRCDIGVEVDADQVAIGDEQVTVVPGGRYAAARFSGTVDDIAVAWRWMMRDWLPASGLQLDARPMFEYYGPGMAHDEATGAFECDIVIPVAPL